MNAVGLMLDAQGIANTLTPPLRTTLDWILSLSFLSLGITLVVTRVKYLRRTSVGSLVVAVAMFIAACGLPSLSDALAVTSPPGWLSSEAKLIATAAVFVIAVAFPFFVPRLGALLFAARSSRSNEQRFIAASNNSSEAFFILESVRDSDGAIEDFRFVFVNENGAHLFSSTPKSLNGDLLCDRFPVMRREGFYTMFEQAVRTGLPLEDECAIDDKLINASWLSYHAEKLGDGLSISMSDVSVRKHAEQEAAASLAFSRSLIAKSPFAVIALDVDGIISEINLAGEEMLGYASEELVHRASALVLHDPHELAMRAQALSTELGEDVKADFSVLTAHPRRGVTDDAEWNYIRKDRTRLEVQLTVTALTNEEQQITGWLCFAYDITERKRSQAYIAHVAQHDALTGLPTRTLLNDRLETAMDRSRRNKSAMALLMIDLDNFKRVNDVHGHAAGDELLVAVAKRLEQTIRRSDTVARMGGDEFVVLLEDLHSAAQAERVAGKIIDAISDPIRVASEELSTSASIGICLFPDGGGDASSLLKNADVAMYFAKSEGRAVCRVFSSEIASATTRRRTLEQALEVALPRDEFHLVYQPQYALRTNRVTGVEALLQWNSEELGEVNPAEFIPIAESTGLMPSIGEWTIRTACREAAALGERLDRKLTVGVNLSPRQFQQDSLPTIVGDALAQSGLSPELLELEITEPVLVSNSAKEMRILDRLRALGLRIAVDGFGTGFASMSYIFRFNVHRLKIDQSLIRAMASERESGAIARAIIAMATGLKINVVAEGVADAAIGELLREEGCDEGQGPYYAPAASIADIAQAIVELEKTMGMRSGVRRAMPAPIAECVLADQ